LDNGRGNISNENIDKLYKTITGMQAEYEFYFPPVFEGFEGLQRSYAQSIRKTAENARREYEILLESEEEPGVAFEIVSEGAFSRFVAENGGQ
jgi:hypothetical protein